MAGPWSPCSATCEKGIQQREVTCVYQLQNGTHVATRPLYCPGPRPAPVQSCEGQDCLSIWEASEWSQVGAWAAASGESGDTTTWALGTCPQGPQHGTFSFIVFVTYPHVSQPLPAPGSTKSCILAHVRLNSIRDNYMARKYGYCVIDNIYHSTFRPISCENSHINTEAWMNKQVGR